MQTDERTPANRVQVRVPIDEVSMAGGAICICLGNPAGAGLSDQSAAYS